MKDNEIHNDVAKHMGEVNARLTGHDVDLTELKDTTKRIDVTTTATKNEVSHFSQGVAEMVQEIREYNKKVDKQDIVISVMESDQQNTKTFNKWRFGILYAWLGAITLTYAQDKFNLIKRLLGD